MSNIEGSGASVDPNISNPFQISASEEENIQAQARKEAEVEARAQLGLGPEEIPPETLVDELFNTSYLKLRTQAYEDKLTSLAQDKSFDDKGGILLGKLLLEGPKEIKGDPMLTPNMAWILEPAFATIYTCLMLEISKMMYEIIRGEAELRVGQMELLGEMALAAKELTIAVSRLEAQGHMVQAANAFAQAAVSAGCLAYAMNSARVSNKKINSRFKAKEASIKETLYGKTSGNDDVYTPDSAYGKLKSAEQAKDTATQSTPELEKRYQDAKREVDSHKSELAKAKVDRDSEISGSMMKAQNQVQMFNTMIGQSIQGIQHVVQAVIELEKGDKEAVLNFIRTLMDMPKNTIETSREALKEIIKLLEAILQGRKEVTEKSQSFHLRG